MPADLVPHIVYTDQDAEIIRLQIDDVPLDAGIKGYDTVAADTTVDKLILRRLFIGKLPDDEVGIPYAVGINGTVLVISKSIHIGDRVTIEKNIHRLNLVDIEGIFNNLSTFLDIFDITATNHLHHKVADCRTFRRPGDNFLTRILHRHFVEEHILAAAADNVQGFVFLARYLFQRLQCQIVIFRKVVVDNVKESSSDIEISLTATGAETIYYAYLTKTEAARYATEDDKVSYLLGKGVSVNGTSVVAKASDMLETKPGTDYVLWALASDASGKYGAVTALECKTKAVAFNNIKVSLTLEKNDPGNVVIGVAAEGAVDYLYWIGRTADNIWKSPSYLGGSAAKAQQYMAENAGHERFTKVMEAYPVVNGKITMKDLTAETNYVIVLMAVDKDGTYSNAVELKFTPRSKSIGEVVLASDPKWEAARPTIEWNKAMFEAAAGLMSGQYGFNVTVPQGFTAYVLAGTNDYLTMGNSSLVLSPS